MKITRKIYTTTRTLSLCMLMLRASWSTDFLVFSRNLGQDCSSLHKFVTTQVKKNISQVKHHQECHSATQPRGNECHHLKFGSSQKNFTQDVSISHPLKYFSFSSSSYSLSHSLASTITFLLSVSLSVHVRTHNCTHFSP